MMPRRMVAAGTILPDPDRAGHTRLVVEYADGVQRYGYRYLLPPYPGQPGVRGYILRKMLLGLERAVNDR